MAPKISPLVGVFFLLLSVLLYTIQSKSTGFQFLQHLEGCHKGQSVNGLHELKRYLEKFGYLNYKQQGNKGHNHANDDEFDELLESAIKAYQLNHHLNISGSLDSNTVKQMIKPRCGVPDVVHGTNSKQLGRKMNHHHIHGVAHFTFFPGQPRWPPLKSSLTYKFRSSAQVSGMNIDTVRSVCARAFQRWAQVSHFTFQEVASTSAADIEIGFHRGNHGDGDRNAFDGRFGTLAHAFAPTRGWCHYDADENWSTSPAPNQVDFESVAVHEIGHLLGLHHSADPNAIMYDTFSYGITKRNLHQDDINGIRALYGL